MSRGLVRLAVAEQVEGDHPVPAVGERGRERLVHAAREQQARHQHQVAAALAVDLVGELLPGVLEAGHAEGILAPNRLAAPQCSTAAMGDKSPNFGRS